MPVVAVLGNHDFESGKQDEVKKILADAGIVMLDGDAQVVEGIGFAGVKGFAGGFGKRALGPWGEEIIKEFVHEAVDEALKLESALARLRRVPRVAVLHYSPIQETVEGEPLRDLPLPRLQPPGGAALPLPGRRPSSTATPTAAGRRGRRRRACRSTTWRWGCCRRPTPTACPSASSRCRARRSSTRRAPQRGVAPPAALPGPLRCRPAKASCSCGRGSSSTTAPSACRSTTRRRWSSSPTPAGSASSSTRSPRGARLLFYDPRSRGRSSVVSDRRQLSLEEDVARPRGGAPLLRPPPPLAPRLLLPRRDRRPLRAGGAAAGRAAAAGLPDHAAAAGGVAAGAAGAGGAGLSRRACRRSRSCAAPGSTRPTRSPSAAPGSPISCCRRR